MSGTSAVGMRKRSNFPGYNTGQVIFDIDTFETKRSKIEAVNFSGIDAGSLLWCCVHLDTYDHHRKLVGIRI